MCPLRRFRDQSTAPQGRSNGEIHRAEAGEEVILTRHAKAVVRLAPVEAALSPEACRKLLEAVRASGAAKAQAAESAARSQNFLYGSGGSPG
jgi:antitoxin (DNA-binding transcriptional repressor) of toxin-antitoxin stability system